MTNYVLFGIVAGIIGFMLGKAFEKVDWVFRTKHLDICEHSTPRCFSCIRWDKAQETRITTFGAP